MVKKEHKDYTIGILIGVIIALVIIFWVYNSINKISTSQANNDALKKISLSKDNFVIIQSGFLNTLYYSQLGCKPDNSIDSFDIKMKLINFPLSIDDAYSNVKTKAYSNGEIVGWKMYDINKVYTGMQYNLNWAYSDDKTLPLVTLPLEVSKVNNVILCFQINNTQVAGNQMTIVDSQTGKQTQINAGQQYGTLSNEVCLDSIKVNALC